nr:acyl-CoA dehydrogenase family protein [Cupriavidus basilensis]
MNLQPTPELTAFQQEVRAFLHENLTPELQRGQRLTSAMYPEPEISGPWQRVLRQRGWLVPLWPEQWGGTGWSPVQRFIFETECALAGAPLVHPMGVRLVGPVILRFGTDAQKRLHLPRILTGEDYWCQGFSEPGAGSDLASLRMRAVADGDDYILNGTKLWTTHAHHANRMFALVRTSSEGKRQDGISFLLIDMTSPGITVRPIATIGGDHDDNRWRSRRQRGLLRQCARAASQPHRRRERRLGLRQIPARIRTRGRHLQPPAALATQARRRRNGGLARRRTVPRR